MQVKRYFVISYIAATNLRPVIYGDYYLIVEGGECNYVNRNKAIKDIKAIIQNDCQESVSGVCILNVMELKKEEFFCYTKH